MLQGMVYREEYYLILCQLKEPEKNSRFPRPMDRQKMQLKN